VEESPRHKGNEGEETAVRELLRLGWTIVKRNYRGRRGEIDILALDGDTLVAVEVKLRTSAYAPENAVHTEKQKRIREALAEYLVSVGNDSMKTRLDIIAIHGSELRHLKDAIGHPSGIHDDD
jgi:putative endonuclease